MTRRITGPLHIPPSNNIMHLVREEPGADASPPMHIERAADPILTLGAAPTLPGEPARPPATVKIQATIGHPDGTVHSDPISDDLRNQQILGDAFATLAQRFLNEGKTLTAVSVKYLRAEWVQTVHNAEGDPEEVEGVTFLNATDPEMREMRKVYANALGGKDGKEHLHNLGDWTYRKVGSRGNDTGPASLQIPSERARNLFTEFDRRRHRIHAITQLSNPADRIEALRLEYLAHQADEKFDKLIQERKNALGTLKSGATDPRIKEGLQKSIHRYDEIQKHLKQTRFAVHWALTHPVIPRTPTTPEISKAQRVQELQKLLEARPGEIRANNPFVENMIPGGGAVNRWANRVGHRTDDAATKAEMDYIRDIVELLICHPEDLDRERHEYELARKGAEVKKDSPGLAILRCILAIDRGVENPRQLLTTNPVLNELLIGLPRSEQLILRGGMEDIVENLQSQVETLQSRAPINLAAIVPGQPPEESIRIFDDRAISGMFSPPPAPAATAAPP